MTAGLRVVLRDRTFARVVADGRRRLRVRMMLIVDEQAMKLVHAAAHIRFRIVEHLVGSSLQRTRDTNGGARHYLRSASSPDRRPGCRVQIATALSLEDRARKRRVYLLADGFVYEKLLAALWGFKVWFNASEGNAGISRRGIGFFRIIVGAEGHACSSGNGYQAGLEKSRVQPGEQPRGSIAYD